MRHQWDAIVVGAGIIGLAVGRELARRGARIAIVDAHAATSGATQASAGILAPHIEASGDDALHRLTTRSLGLYDGFVAGVERDAGATVEYARRGTLELAATPAEAERLVALGATLERAGIPAQWLEGADAVALEPAMAMPIGGLFIAAHGYVRVAQLTAGLAAAARERGATLLEHRKVERVEPQAGGVAVTIGGEVHDTAVAVIAAGSWSGGIVPGGPAVAPVRGQLIELRWHGPAISRVLWSERCYIVPWADGGLLVGATVEDAGFDQRTTVDGLRGLMAAACELLPSAGQATFVAARAGLRPKSPDGVPFIGRDPRHGGVVYATAHYRNGVLLAPLTASIVADLVIDDRADAALALTALER